MSTTSEVRRVFDAAYYEHFYENSESRAATTHDARRQARFIAAYLKFMQLPVSRILNLGCGLGRCLRALGREYPRARLVGVEWSEFLCERYGWEQGSVVDFESSTRFDLVLCHDVVQYLTAEEATVAVANLARLSRGALYFGVLTAEDWREVCDQQRTDNRVHLRSRRWYRRRLASRFTNVGGGLYLRKPVRVPVWSLDRLD